MKSLKVYVNGSLVDKEKAAVSVFDHGFLYGDGVFEGIRAYNGRVFRLRDHLERLYDSAKYILLAIPLSPREMETAIIKTLKANGLRDAYIRLVVTRGAGTLGLDPDQCSHSAVVIITDHIALYPKELYRKGLSIVTVPTVRTHFGAVSPRVKSLNYLNNILAKMEGRNAGVAEALMLSDSGFVVECSGDNIFIVKRRVLYTPPAWEGILKGVTREVVIELAGKARLPVREVPLTRYDLYTADECFLTGTAAEIIPVVSVDSHPIGDRRPGRITLGLLRRFNKLTHSAR